MIVAPADPHLTVDHDAATISEPGGDELGGGPEVGRDDAAGGVHQTEALVADPATRVVGRVNRDKPELE